VKLYVLCGNLNGNGDFYVVIIIVFYIYDFNDCTANENYILLLNGSRWVATRWLCFSFDRRIYW
jgi:hypothetical protein